MGKYSKKRDSVQPDLTPLIDVVFLLIVFFMVTTTFNNFGSIQVDLPSSSIQKNVKNKNIEIIIDKNGEYHISDNDKYFKIEFDKIAENLKDVKEATISADKDLKYQTIIDLITKVKENGVENVGLNFYE